MCSSDKSKLVCCDWAAYMGESISSSDCYHLSSPCALAACPSHVYTACWLQVVIQYTSTDRLLQQATRVWAHAGHSGWQYTLDVELFRNPQDSSRWTGIYK